MILNSFFPTLETKRLKLRQFELSDKKRLREIANSREIAEGTFIPYPYKDEFAVDFIESQFRDYKNGNLVNFAVVIDNQDLLIGSMGISIDNKLNEGEIGFWIGVDYWGNGYCTEAARSVLHYGFTERKLDKIFAFHFRDNIASSKVLQKIGMELEGIKRNEFWHMGELKDTVNYGLYKTDYDKLWQNI